MGTSKYVVHLSSNSSLKEEKWKNQLLSKSLTGRQTSHLIAHIHKKAISLSIRFVHMKRVRLFGYAKHQTENTTRQFVSRDNLGASMIACAFHQSTEKHFLDFDGRIKMLCIVQNIC